jgi:hypothetical protein
MIVAFFVSQGTMMVEVSHPNVMQWFNWAHSRSRVTHVLVEFSEYISMVSVIVDVDESYGAIVTMKL